MSLILDALKKVEREKETGKPGVLVVGSVRWSEPPPASRRGRLALGAVLALGLVAAGTWWVLRPGRTGAPAAAPAGLVPTAEPSLLPTVPPSAAAASPALAPPTVDAPPVVPAEDLRPAAAPAPLAAAPPFVSQSPLAPSGSAAARSTAPLDPTRAAATATPPGASPLGATAPARPPAPPAAADVPAPMPELRLAAISVRDGQPVAIVNDRLVREGDSFDGVRVVRIGEAEVEVEFRGRRHVLRF